MLPTLEKPVQAYPGISKIGRIDVMNYRRTSDPRISRILFFTFNFSSNPSVVLPVFEKYFDKIVLETYRVIKQQPVVIEACFTNINHCYRIMKQVEPYYKINFGSHVRAKVEFPLPMEPQLKVYTLDGLPSLDYPMIAREHIRAANIIRIVPLLKQNAEGSDKSVVLGNYCIVDIVPGSADGYYNGTMCVILKNFKGLVDTFVFNRMIEAYGRTYTLSECSYHYCYCSFCHSLDLHPEGYCRAISIIK
ncbi:hypothetical protein BJV82DRAFT_693566 [Fennellomyces sp. T-0311]|nr:hypothetical protein BJV82DRAFT_693566 [Fennellomyces sp. T-0311]